MVKLGVLGNPVAHSVSPQLHEAFAKQFSMAIDYQKKCIDLDDFENAVDALRKLGWLGANVTLPFKNRAFIYADSLTDRARLSGTVNTFIFQADRCVGDNTDGVGFIRDLKHKRIDVNGKNVLIIGAGGAAQGMLGELINEKPSHIFIHNRTADRMEKLITHYQAAFLIKPYVSDYKIDVIINASAQDFSVFDLSIDLSGVVAYDLNYGERHCAFADWARRDKAMRIYDGMGMLIEQGAESFFQWFGLRPNTRVVGQGSRAVSTSVSDA